MRGLGDISSTGRRARSLSRREISKLWGAERCGATPLCTVSVKIRRPCKKSAVKYKQFRRRASRRKRTSKRYTQGL
jgi:hypothetical protein